MVNPVPGRAVTTPYHKTGSHWTACGWHTGQDYAAPHGTTIVAARAGVTKHVNYGSSFGSKQLAVQCDDGTEDFYAHMSSRIGSGVRVAAGARVGAVGSEGNSTGPHLHFERHRSKNAWNCSNMDDPMKSHNEGATVNPGNVYVSKLVYKQDDSDSVKRLQDTLNGISLSGGVNLPITGGYFDKTKAEVEKWQKQKANDKSVVDGSKVTPAQANQLFAGTGNTVIDDVSKPEPPPVTPPDELIINGFGLWKWYSGKPGGEFVLHPGEWKKMGIREPASNIKLESSEHRLLYLRVELPVGRIADRVLETKFIRASGDATAYDSEEYGTKKDSHPYYNVHFEDGDGAGGEWWVKVTGGTDPIKFTTRYAKQHTLYVDPVIAQLHQQGRAAALGLDLDMTVLEND